MNVKELRVGNLIRPVFNGTNPAQTPFAVTGMFIQQCHSLELREGGSNVGHEGIPITEEWLLRFGFNENYSSGVKKKYFHHSLLYDGGNALAYVIYSKEPEKNGILFWGNAVPLCYNVHQLQNLFYALTGQELTLND